MDNCFNKVFPSFDPINPELFPGHRIIDTFSNHFLFQPFNKQVNCNVTFWVQELDRITIELLESPSTALIICDANVKNNVATSIAHIHIRDRPITKTLHHALNITSTEAELVAIRCSINQATNHDFISTIIIVTDLIHIAKKIFDPFSHPFQKHVVSILTILKKLCFFFFHHPDNHIEFWECPSCSKWHLHKAVDSETKSFRLTLTYSNKLSWDLSRKLECDDLTNRWKMTFQASDLKGNQFLDLMDGDNKLLEPSYIKGGPWLQNFGHSNLLCAKATRAITNYTLTDEYRLKFFSNKEFSCLCNQYPIELRWHILHDCKRFNEYWNSCRDSIIHFVIFLEHNHNAFAFSNDIT